MCIISYKRFMFKSVTGETFTTKGGGILEEVPDWVKETQLYKWAAGDGDIIETVDRSDKAAVAADDKAKKTKAGKGKGKGKSSTETAEEPAAEESEPVEPAEEA